MMLDRELQQLLAGPGPVLRLGAEHLRQLADGIAVEEGSQVAVVLEGVLELVPDPGELLRELAWVLADDGVLVARVPGVMGTGRGFDRKRLLALLEVAGYEVTTLRLVREHGLPWFPLPVDGSTIPAPKQPSGSLSAAELEELGAASLLVSARKPPADPPVCTILTTGALPPDLELTESPHEVIEVEQRLDEPRGAAWNRAAKRATGSFLVFLDEGCKLRTGWLDELLGAAAGTAELGAVGGRALAFGSASLPSQQLPYLADRVDGAPAALDAAGLLVSRRAFVQVGGFDELLGEELDGADLCLHLRAYGYKLVQAAPGAVARPWGGAGDQGVRHFACKWSGRIAPDPAPPTAAARPSRASSAPILWTGPMLERSGYSEEARNFVLGLDAAGLEVQANPLRWIEPETSFGRDAPRLGALFTTRAPDRFINVVHSVPYARLRIGGSVAGSPLIEYFTPHPKAVFDVGRTMFESDRLPQGWAERCNRMDEVWVPSRFNLETFSRAGVDPAKLFRVPGGVDTELYDPSLPPVAIAGAAGFVFLSVFAWSRRKGWDALSRAYMEEFDGSEDVTLVLKILPAPGQANVRAEFESYVRDRLGADPLGRPRILHHAVDPGADEMPRLYRAADAFVLPSRGEGYGRPLLEAMAMGLPTIGTRWSGNLDFMTDENSYLVDCDVVDVPEAGWREIPEYRGGHRWAEPSVPSLRQAMRRVFEERGEGKARGALARERVVAEYSRAAVAAVAIDRLRQAGVQPAPRRSAATPVTVRWEGPHQIRFGIAEVNRGFAQALAAQEGVDVVPASRADDGSWLYSRPSDVTVRHRWPPDFTPPRVPWVTYQPWEFGSLPIAWIEPLNRQVHEAWVPSSYVRDCFVRSGVDPSKVAVVPYGIDPQRFQPGVPPLALATAKRHRFLFVGGTITRKGPDLLLDAYLRTFRPEDDVCLVVKDFGADTFYEGQTMRERFREAAADAGNPEILYLDQELADGLMPALYAACHCLVHPYRGEGFGLPIAEAMACGLPVIVPARGACLDFCDPSVAYLVPAREMRWREARVGSLATVEQPWWAAVDVADLGAAMRRVVEQPDEARELGRRASERIRRDFTWERAAEIAAGRLRELARRRKRLTACLVVRDEERSLPACLESLRGLADEVVVVDTGSRDHTVEAARAHGAKVVEHAWNDDFAAARNESLRHATGDWVLVLDADERLDEAGRAEIGHLVQHGSGCYLMAQLTPSTDGRQVEQMRARLFPNDPRFKFTEPVDEELSAPPGAAVRQATTVIHHEATAAERKRRLRRLEGLREVAARPGPGFVSHAYHLARAQLELGDHDRAEQEASRALKALAGASARGTPALVAATQELRARALLRGGHFAAAATAARQAVAADRGLAGAHFLLGAALQEEGRLVDAAAAYRSALDAPFRRTVVPADPAEGGWRALLALADVEARLGRPEAAEKALAEARRRGAPSRPPRSRGKAR